MNTYYVGAAADGTPWREKETLCRNTGIPYPEDASKYQYVPPIHIPLGAEEMTVNMRMENGPEYDLKKGPAHYWRKFDAMKSRNGTDGS